MTLYFVGQEENVYQYIYFPLLFISPFLQSGGGDLTHGNFLCHSALFLKEYQHINAIHYMTISFKGMMRDEVNFTNITLDALLLSQPLSHIKLSSVWRH